MPPGRHEDNCGRPEILDARALSVELVALRVLEDRVKERIYTVKEQLAGELDPGDRKVAALDSGQVVGAVTYAKGRARAYIYDEAAFTAWVGANRPDEIVTTIRGSYLKTVLAEAARVGDAVDKTGEVIPGVVVEQGLPYLTVKPNPDGLPALLDAIHASQLLALEGQ